MNKASGGDGIPVELIQILKDDAVKVCTQYDSKFGKFSRAYMTGKSIFIPIPKKYNAKECSNPSYRTSQGGGSHGFPSKMQASFNLMAAITICSDFGEQENKICHCFHFSPVYLPRWWDLMPWS